MINYIYICSFTFLLIGDDDINIQSIKHAYNERKKRETEYVCNSRKWEGLINRVCSRRWRCWMTFSHMDSIYRQAWEQDNDWHLSCIRVCHEDYASDLSSTHKCWWRNIHMYRWCVVLDKWTYVCRDLFQSYLIHHKVNLIVAFIKIHPVTYNSLLFVYCSVISLIY